MLVGDKELDAFIACIKQKSRFDFSEYSQKSLIRRIEKVLVDNTCTFDDLIKKLNQDLRFLETVVKQITVNTTELFRDPNFWQEFRNSLAPELEKKEKIKIWHAGCSTGQEVYSMLILLHELKLFDKTDVFATDINEDVIEYAKTGVYPYRHLDDYRENFNKVIKDNPFGKSFSHLPFEKYFEINSRKSSLKVAEFLRKKPIFSCHDLVSLNNPFNEETYDIIICRNVLIYFNADLQKKIYHLFHKNMHANSYLILGMQESMGWFMRVLFANKGSFYIKQNM